MQDNKSVNQRLHSVHTFAGEISDSVNESLDLQEDIVNRQRAQHLRVMEFLYRINEDLSLQFAHGESTNRLEMKKMMDDIQDIKEKIKSFDRANDYFIKEINRLAGFSNL